MSIHYAKLNNSPRLQRLLAFLRDGKPHTTRNILKAIDICAVNTAICELRRNGFDVACRCIGKGRFEYQLERDTVAIIQTQSIPEGLLKDVGID